MRKRIPIKNHYQEIQLIAQRCKIGLLIILLLLFLIVIRLGYLQIYKNQMYDTLSTKNWLDLVPIEPTRGLIYDRNGILLAENMPVFSLDIIPIRVKNFNETLAELKKIIAISDYDLSQFKKQRKQYRRFDEMPLKVRLTEEEVARFIENQYRFPGVFVKARLIRRYPRGEAFSHVLGYLGRINSQELQEIDNTNYSASYYIGKLGIEKFYEDELHGNVGYQQVENDATGKPLRILQEIKSTPGKNLYLTIDSTLQELAYEALGSNRGAVVAIQPGTGQVLALVSKPAYDPNLFVLGISQKEYLNLQQSEDRPLFNRALRGLYPPASTIKPYLALGALDDEIIDTDYTIRDLGWFQLKNNSHRYRDWTSVGHGQVNITKAIVSSCDTFFYELASKMGIHLMDETLKKFGFGTLTGIDIDEELPGFLASPELKLSIKGENWYEGDTILSGIGQGLMQVTPLQLAFATSTLANRGNRFIPYLLFAEQVPGEAYVAQSPLPLAPIVLNNEENWDLVHDAMQKVIAIGTGRVFGKLKNYSIAAKTGTGQVISRRSGEEAKQKNLPEKLRDHHLFIAFAPVEKPQIAIAVVTENSDAAVKTARLILDSYLSPEKQKKVGTMQAIIPRFLRKPTS